MKSKTKSLFVTQWLSVMILTLSPVVNAKSIDSAKMQMKVSADIPEFIQIRGLPKKTTLKETSEGILKSEILQFHVERNGASKADQKPFLLTITSNQGQQEDQYNLAHKNGHHVAIFAGLKAGQASSLDNLKNIPTSGLKSTTWASPDSETTTHSLAFFNNNIQYLSTRPAGSYSANFTIKVEAQ